MIATLLADPDPRRPLASPSAWAGSSARVAASARVGATARIGAPDRVNSPARVGSSVRVSRPPMLEPPFDDERPDFDRPMSSAPFHPTGSAPRSDDLPHRPPQATGAPGPQVDSGSGRAALRYVRLCIEVLNGFRPASHLRAASGVVEFGEVLAQLRYRRNGRGHFRNRPTEGVSHQLAGNASARGVTGRANRPPISVGARVAVSNAPVTTGGVTARNTVATGAATTGAVRAHDRNAAAANAPFGLIRLRVSEPLDGVAEVVAVLSQADASIAMALRLERRGADWLCTVAQVI